MAERFAGTIAATPHGRNVTLASRAGSPRRVRSPPTPATHTPTRKPRWPVKRRQAPASRTPPHPRRAKPPGSPLPPPTLVERVARPSVADRTALVDDQGGWSYADLVREAAVWRDRLARARCRAGDRVAYLARPGRSHVAAQLGIWAGGAVAVPLAVGHPRREIEHVLDDARPRVVVADLSLPRAHDLTAAATARRMGVVALPPPTTPPPATPPPAPPPPLATPGGPALIIYTSGTTGRPRGALTTHAQPRRPGSPPSPPPGAWTENDRILHTLPLHHIHGVVNALACALWSGAAVRVRLRRAGLHLGPPRVGCEVTLFMSVPTVYTRLDPRMGGSSPGAAAALVSRSAARLRLMVSGSAALPAATLERWRQITGPHPPRTVRHDRNRHGAVQSAAAANAGPATLVSPCPESKCGLWTTMAGSSRAGSPPHVARPAPAASPARSRSAAPRSFSEYWQTPRRHRRPPSGTAGSSTGDEACLGEGGYYRILGRRSVDIVKTGGYKVSALEVEELYRTHPGVGDVAVVGVPHPEWGEQLRAAWVAPPTGAPSPPDAAALRAWGKERLAPYKVPHRFLRVPDLPRNAMGKVRKTAVARMLVDPPAAEDPAAETPAAERSPPAQDPAT